MRIKENINKNTSSIKFNYDLFERFNLDRLLKVLKIKDFCVELFYIDKIDLKCIKYLECCKMDFSIIQLNKCQNKLVININTKNQTYFEKFFLKYPFDEMNLWDKNVILNNDLEIQLNNTCLYVNYNREENNEIELIYNNNKYRYLTTPQSMYNDNISNINPFRYRGYYYDVETGFYYLNSRYYDPSLGRFINADDIYYANVGLLNGLNLYAYCGNNPVNSYDSDGNIPDWLKW